MAKGSVRKKGKKWYYRFYVEDASGKMVQKEYAGTESKSETEKLLRKALEDYENKKFVAKADSLTVGELLDMWAEEELKTGTLSNGTVENYLGAIRCINISAKSGKIEPVGISVLFNLCQLRAGPFHPHLSIQRRRENRRKQGVHALPGRRGKISFHQLPMLLGI